MGEPPQVMLTYTYKLYLPFYTTGDTYLYFYPFIQSGHCLHLRCDVKDWEH